MADWFGTRKNIKWSYMRVDWATWEEVEEYRQITGGSDEESYFTELKGGGSLAFVGEPPSTVDMVRTYYEFDDASGEHVRVPVSTMLVESVSVTHDGYGQTTGEMTLYSPLKVADDYMFGLPYTVKKGEKAVDFARRLLENTVHLKTSTTPSNYTLTNDHTFDPDDSLLTAVNWLLDVAGYGSAYPDAYGRIVLAPYVDAARREPVFTFKDDELSIMYPELEDTNDYSDTPNVVRMYHEDERLSTWVMVSNIDPDSPSSLVNNGNREKTMYEEVSEISAAMPDNPTDAQIQAVRDARIAELESLARQKLSNNSAQIEYVEISNGFYPLAQGDFVEIQYGGRSWHGTVTNVSRDHTTESKCKTKVRRYSIPSLKTDTQGGAW